MADPQKQLQTLSDDYQKLQTGALRSPFPFPLSTLVALHRKQCT